MERVVISMAGTTDLDKLFGKPRDRAAAGVGGLGYDKWVQVG